MPNSVTKGRSRIAILAVVSVIASLFTLAALPASAATGDVEAEATWSACVNAATEDAGFTDTTGHFADAWIDCIAHYGITTGTTATTYSPGQAVTRAQMALFLIRAAGPAGIGVPAASDQGFTDIAGLPQATQDAINQLAALDITKGTSATTYGPNDTVARYQMALFLNRFLAKAGVNCDDAADLADDGLDNASATCNDASGFTDIGAVSFEAHNAIEDVYDFGITTGTTATTYSPFAAVNRGQMAAFIGRMLGHTNARPAGISFQAAASNVNEGSGTNLQVSVRDASFNPVVDALVDVFHIDSADVATAFNADGTCTANVSPTVGGTVCAIELAEAVSTDSSGNDTFPSGNLTEATTFWAWTGNAGATFDADTTAVVSVEVTTSAVPAAWLVTTNLSDATTLSGVANGNLAKYGTTVTQTYQLVDAVSAGDPVAKAGVSLTVRITISPNGVSTTSSTTTYTSDANGQFTITLPTPSDPSAGDDYTRVDVDYTNVGDLPRDLAELPNSEEDVVYDDDASAANDLVAASLNAYVTASDTGSGSANTVTGTLYDQYGLGMGGQTVAFTSDHGEGVGSTPINRTTNSSGVATLGYTRDSAATGIETVTASWNSGALTDTAQVIWVDSTPADGTYTIGDVDNLIVDKDADTVVVLSGGVYYAFTWEAGDQFRIVGAPSTQAAFETALTVTDDLSIVWDADGVSAFDITANN